MSYLWAYILPQRSQRPDHVGKCCLIKKSQEWEDKQRKQRSKKFYGWDMYSFALKQRQFTALVGPHVHILSATAKQNLSPSPSPVPLPHSLLGRWPSLAGLHDTNYLSNLQDEIAHLLKAVLWLLTHPSNPTQTPASSQITNTWYLLSPLPGVKMAVLKPFAVSRGPWTQGSFLPLVPPAQFLTPLTLKHLATDDIVTWRLRTTVPCFDSVSGWKPSLCGIEFLFNSAYSQGVSTSFLSWFSRMVN